MTRKKKGIHRERNSADLADKSKTIRLRVSQATRFAASDYGHNFSGLVSDLIDDHFRAEDFLISSPDIGVDHGDIALIIGAGIDAIDVANCIKAIAEGNPLPDIRITPKSLAYFKMYFDTDKKESLDMLIKPGIELIEQHLDIYFVHVLQRITITKMAKIIDLAPLVEEGDKQAALAFANTFQSAEDDWLHYRVSLSSNLKFAMYVCKYKAGIKSMEMVPEFIRSAQKEFEERFGNTT